MKSSLTALLATIVLISGCAPDPASAPKDAGAKAETGSIPATATPTTATEPDLLTTEAEIGAAVRGKALVCKLRSGETKTFTFDQGNGLRFTVRARPVMGSWTVKEGRMLLTLHSSYGIGVLNTDPMKVRAFDGGVFLGSARCPYR